VLTLFGFSAICESDRSVKILPRLGFSPDLPARYLALPCSFLPGRLPRFVLPKNFRDSGSSLFVCCLAPFACLRTQTSCIRDPKSILVFFHFLSYLTCPSLSLFVCCLAPFACLRTQTSCIRDPKSILVFFHFLSYLTCPFLTRACVPF